MYAHQYGPTSIPTAMPLIVHATESAGDAAAATPDRVGCWRPIQSLVFLTNDKLEVVRGARAALGNGLDAKVPPAPPASPGKERLETVLAPAGSMILWDARLSCAATPCLEDGCASEVLHVSYLPNVAANRRYSALVQMPQLALARDRDWGVADLMAGFP